MALAAHRRRLGTAIPQWGGTTLKKRTATEERRLGIIWIVGGIIYLAATLVLWWLDVTHNTEGDPGDPWLPPIFALIPLAIGFYRLHHTRTLATR